jgi:Tfp pilus assembly protein PilO
VENSSSNPEAQVSVAARKPSNLSQKLIVVLLVCLLLVQVIGLASDFSAKSAESAHLTAKQAKIAEIVSESEKERAALELLMTSYQADAYHGTLDRIAEQQLVATEYSIRALQILGKQNNAIIDLLADQP